jgi:hypothetical protein|nr:MAG TPA: hypothetical protein [Siphoviridae sp. cttiG1]
MPWSDGVFEVGGPKISKLAQKFLILFKILCLSWYSRSPLPHYYYYILLYIIYIIMGQSGTNSQLKACF